MGRPRKEIPTRKAEVTCRYCEYFVDQPITIRKGSFGSDNVKLRHNKRWCTIANKQIDVHEPICSLFLECKSFWCRNNHHWQGVLVCGHKKGKGDAECKNCPQYLEVVELRRLIHRRATATQMQEEVKFVKRELPAKEEPKRLIRRFNID